MINIIIIIIIVIIIIIIIMRPDNMADLFSFRNIVRGGRRLRCFQFVFQFHFGSGFLPQFVLEILKFFVALHDLFLLVLDLSFVSFLFRETKSSRKIWMLI